MNIDFDKFCKAAQAVQHILIAIAIVVGGGWTLYHFVEVDSPRAQLRYEKEKEEATSKPNLVLQFEAKTFRQSERNYILGNLNMTNSGNTILNLDISGNALISIDHLSFIDSQFRQDHTEFQEFVMEKITNENQFFKYVNIGLFPGREMKIPFLFEVKNSGFYMIQAKIPVNPTERTYKSASPAYGFFDWSASKIIEVAGAP